MSAQRERDWNQRYLNRDTPWDEPTPFAALEATFASACAPGARVLEVGCGLGANARRLAELGYHVTAVDVAPEAVARAEALHAHPRLRFRCADITRGDVIAQCGADAGFDAAFDKGCLHGFTTHEARAAMAQAMCDALADGGVWICIAGNADNPDDLAKRRADHYPRLSLTDLARAVEPWFEVQSVRCVVYGEQVRFKAWLGVFRKRAYFYAVEPSTL